MEAMAKHRSHSIEFKRQIAQESTSDSDHGGPIFPDLARGRLHYDGLSGFAKMRASLAAAFREHYAEMLSLGQLVSSHWRRRNWRLLDAPPSRCRTIQRIFLLVFSLPI
jgi:hypothetical protein